MKLGIIVCIGDMNTIVVAGKVSDFLSLIDKRMIA